MAEGEEGTEAVMERDCLHWGRQSAGSSRTADPACLAGSTQEGRGTSVCKAWVAAPRGQAGRTPGPVEPPYLSPLHDHLIGRPRGCPAALRDLGCSYIGEHLQGHHKPTPSSWASHVGLAGFGSCMLSTARAPQLPPRPPFPASHELRGLTGVIYESLAANSHVSGAAPGAV